MKTVTLVWHSLSKSARAADHSLDDLCAEPVLVSDDILKERDISLEVSFFCSDNRLILEEHEFRDGELYVRTFYDLGEFVDTSPISDQGIKSVKKYADYVLQGYIESSGTLAHCPSSRCIDDRDANFNPIA